MTIPKSEFIDYIAKEVAEREGIIKLGSKDAKLYGYTENTNYSPYKNFSLYPIDSPYPIYRTSGLIFYQDADIIDPEELSYRRKATLRFGVQQLFENTEGKTYLSKDIESYLSKIPTEGVIVAASKFGANSRVGEFHLEFLLKTDFNKVITAVPYYWGAACVDYSRFKELHGKPIEEAIKELLDFCSDIENYRRARKQKIAV